MADIYESDRVGRIGRIQRAFNTAVRVGDVVEFGINGDPQYPPTYRNARPTGKVIKVKGVNTDGATIRVKLDTGGTTEVHPYSLDPRKCWEFKNFDQVLQRTRAANGITDAPEYGRASSDTVPRSEYDKLVQRVELLSQKLDTEAAATRDFSGAMVASFSEMANEVQNNFRSNSKETPFCDTFTKEYRSMVKTGKAPQTSAFDSDFSDTDY
jgi:hypothetical protein